MPDIHTRGPNAAGPDGEPFAPVLIYGLPMDDEFEAARNRYSDPTKLYAVADSAATLVLMGTLWQLGTTSPHLKLRGPGRTTPPIIYGVPDEAQLNGLRDEARDSFGANARIAYFVARTPEDVIWLQYLWQTER